MIPTGLNLTEEEYMRLLGKANELGLSPNACLRMLAEIGMLCLDMINNGTLVPAKK